MSEALTEYRKLLKKLSWIRWAHLGHNSEEEDAHLEAMDEVWWQLTDEEREMVSTEPSRQDPIQPATTDPQMIDLDVQNIPGLFGPWLLEPISFHVSHRSSSYQIRRWRRKLADNRILVNSETNFWLAEK